MIELSLPYPRIFTLFVQGFAATVSLVFELYILSVYRDKNSNNYIFSWKFVKGDIDN